MAETDGSESPCVKFENAHVAALWGKYWLDRGGPARNDLLVHYLPVVRGIARRVIAKLPAEIQLDDMVQAGCLGLLQAIHAFDPARGVKFQAFCARRVRGAMLDEIRQADWVPRNVRRQSKHIQAAASRLEQEHGRTPTDCEIRTSLKPSPGESDAMILHRRVASHVSMETIIVRFADETDGLDEPAWLQDGEALNPADVVSSRDLIESIPRRLSGPEQVLLRRYYHEHRTLKDIGDELGVSAARVCQLRKEIIAKLRGELVP